MPLHDARPLDLFTAPVIEPENPLPTVRRRPPPDVPLDRAVRDAIEDVLETRAPDGVSWAWARDERNGAVSFVLSDCRASDGVTVAALLTNDAQRDAYNVSWRIDAITNAPLRREPPARRVA